MEAASSPMQPPQCEMWSALESNPVVSIRPCHLTHSTDSYKYHTSRKLWRLPFFFLPFLTHKFGNGRILNKISPKILFFQHNSLYAKQCLPSPFSSMHLRKTEFIFINFLSSYLDLFQCSECIKKRERERKREKTVVGFQEIASSFSLR